MVTNNERILHVGLFLVLLLKRSFGFGFQSSVAIVATAATTTTHRVTARLSATLEDNLDTSATNNAPKNDDDVDEAFQPYRGAQPAEALSDIFIPSVMPSSSKIDGTAIDEKLLWVPQTDTVSFRPLLLCTSGGYYVNLLRVQGAGLLSRHRHPGPVHGHVLKGSWRYLEHDWVATEGSYVFEPPGEIHTLVVPKGVDEMITLFHVTGSLLYCDPDGTVVGADDVFTKLELAKAHYTKVGLGEDFVQQFVR